MGTPLVANDGLRFLLESPRWTVFSFSGWSGRQRPWWCATAGPLAIAALLNPLRRRLQTFVDRRFYRGKYDAAKTLATFSARLREETDLDALNTDLVGVVQETIQHTHASLWLRPNPGEQRSASSTGEP